MLVEDPELGQQLDGPRLVLAARDCVASTAQLPAGAWSPAEGLLIGRDGLGLLVLEGVIVHRVGVAGRHGAEVLGVGDVLRPWELEDMGGTLARTGRWRALCPCRIALLDSEFAIKLARYPEVTTALFSRAIRRANHIAVQMAIVQQPRIDVRLRMLFWELADRWGTVHGDGVHVPLQLTHAMLADLVAARRPTVTKALRELADTHHVNWTGKDWLIGGDPPLELQEIPSVPATGPQ